jgi:hypothetical protein
MPGDLLGEAEVLVKIGRGLGRLARVGDLDDPAEACRRLFASNTRWTIVRCQTPSALAHKDVAIA